MGESLQAIREFCVATKDFFVTSGKILWYLTHPKQLGLLVWGGCVKYSLPICLMICLLAFIFYMSDHNKAKKYIAGSFFGYFVIQMINAAL